MHTKSYDCGEKVPRVECHLVIVEDRSSDALRRKVSSGISALEELSALTDTLTNNVKDQDESAIIQQMIEGLQKVGNVKHPVVVTAMTRIALFYFDNIDLDKSETWATKAWSLSDDVNLDPRLLSTLSLLLIRTRKCEQALNTVQRLDSSGLNGAELATVSYVTGLAYTCLGEFLKGKDNLTEALRQEKGVEGSRRIPQFLSDIALLYGSAGQFERAKKYLIEAASEAKANADMLQLSAVTSELAIYYLNEKKYVQAQSLLEESLRYIEPSEEKVKKVLKGKNRLYLGLLYNAARMPKEARDSFIGATQLLPPSLELRFTKINLAFLDYWTGKQDIGLQVLEETVAEMRRDHISDKGVFLLGLKALALAEAISKDAKGALSHLREAIPIEQGLTQAAFSIGNVSSSLALMSSPIGSYKTYDLFVWLVSTQFANDRELVTEAFNYGVNQKASVLKHEKRSRLAGLQTDNGSKKTQLQMLNKRISNAWTAFDSKNTVPQAVYEEFEVLLSERSTIEGQLSENVIRQRMDRKDSITIDLKKRLTSLGDVLLTYISINAIDLDLAREWASHDNISMSPVARRAFFLGNPISIRNYLVFILRRDGELTVKNLGNQDSRDEDINSALRHIYEGKNYEESLKKISSWLWKDMENELRKTVCLEPTETNPCRIIISSDGQLSLLPFAALPGNDGKSLIEKNLFVSIYSPEDILSDDGHVSHIQPLVAIGDVDYKLNFPSLINTRNELEYLRSRWTNVPATFYLDKDKATADNLYSRLPATIVHFGTHGFWKKESSLSPVQLKFNYKFPYLSFLLRSGLVLAEESASSHSELDDGRLYALEISDLDLAGTALVVLSACETGAGEVIQGEGVIGIRRAFVLAGARAVIMSLWNVSDDIAAHLIISFYENLTANSTNSIGESLRMAQLSTIKKLRSQYGFASPYLWAMFVIEGAAALTNSVKPEL
jgi:CHAT domain-containing protein/Tfp pilus assembly protein PilF